MLRFFFIYLLFCCFSHLVFAQTVTWAIPPTYESLEEYGDIYKIREHRKVGLADVTGKTLIPAVYDSITPFHEHLALALEYDGDKYSIKGIINQHNYGMVKIIERYYMTKEYPFFSEGKLVIFNESNKYGYLQPDGSLFKACQYRKTYPFYQGLACIQKKENEIAYLKTNGNELTTQLESDKCILSKGSSFNEKGEAYVQGEAVGVKHCITDTEGKHLRKATFSGNTLKNYEFRKPFRFSLIQGTIPPVDGIDVFLKKGKYGFTKKGNTMLPAQFTEASPFKGGYAKVKKHGKYGVLKLSSGNFQGRMIKNSIKVENGKSETVDYQMQIPIGYLNKPVKFEVEEENSGNKTVLSFTESGNDSKDYTFIPTLQDKETEKSYIFSLQADGLLLWEDFQHITIQYIESYPPVLSLPQVASEFKTDSEGYVRADNNNKVDIYATIENRSSETLHITITIGGNGVTEETRSLSVGTSSYGRISTSINDIKERKPVEVFVKTSTGLKQSKIIKVKPFI